MDWGGLDSMVGSAVTKAGHTQAAMEEIGEAMVSSTAERFDTSTAPDGSAWKPSQRVEKDGGKTLVVQGASGLMGSIGYEASPANLAWGSNKVHARIHQLGGEAGRDHAVEIEARPYLGMSEEDIDEAREILADHMIGILGGSK